MNVITPHPLQADRKALLEIVPRNARCAEIGVWKGEFSRHVVDLTAPTEYYLIDPWAFQPDFPNRMFGGKVAKSQLDMDQIHDSVCQEFDMERIKIVRATSEEASALFDDAFFDWVYIDGNHYFDYVRKDLDLWLPKVKPGGLLTGDDYLWRDETGNCHVAAAVSDFLSAHPELHGKSFGNQFLIEKLAG